MTGGSDQEVSGQLSPESVARITRNEAVFRDVNEAIARTMAGGTEPPRVSHFTCECSMTSCTAQIALTLEAYRKIRQDPRLFFVRPGHSIESVERVVHSHGSYHIVEKIAPPGPDIAEATAP